jgi:hypothetical protein
MIDRDQVIGMLAVIRFVLDRAGAGQEALRGGLGEPKDRERISIPRGKMGKVRGAG